ncbi:hypothetical protein ABZZ20_32505 [Streptomyces sp. NPDC006430]|uniref:hypothetical protein n=1 Tax=Streptomyces sp. NPDC006430 TaxID=3154299 RepID=UPI0033BAFD05
MDIDEVTRELYGLRPDEFTAARDERAALARASVDPAAAKAIKALRRPALAAWCSNLLVRHRPTETAELLRLGRALRDAQRTLVADRLRELSHHQHVVISAMARDARGLAGESGHPVSEAVQHEVEQILHAVLADPATAEEWAGGRMVKVPVVPAGFGVEPAPGSRPLSARPARAAPAKTPRSAAGHRGELDRARATADAAREEARRSQGVLRRAAAELQHEQDRLRRAEARVTDLRNHLDRAEADLRRARSAWETAFDRKGESDVAARGAQEAADAAEAALDFLESHAPG